MWNTASIAESLHDAKDYGFVGVAGAKLNWPTIKTSRDAYIKRLNVRNVVLKHEECEYMPLLARSNFLRCVTNQYVLRVI